MSRSYGTGDEEIRYTWRDDLFGPKVSQDEMDALEMRAITEGWDDWFYHIVSVKNRRKRRWLLAYLRDGVISVSITRHNEDVYYDDDPFENRD